MAPSAVPGEPVMYWLGPLLPADVTTITPALAASTRRGGRVVLRAEGRPERHVDDVHLVLDRPLDRFDGHVGRAAAAEHADRVDVRLRGYARADLQA